MASLIAKIFPDELGIGQQARVMGTLLGLSLGVVTGSMLKEVLGYFGVFLTFSLLLLLSTSLLLLSKRISISVRTITSSFGLVRPLKLGDSLSDCSMGSFLMPCNSPWTPLSLSSSEPASIIPLTPLGSSFSSSLVAHSSLQLCRCSFPKNGRREASSSEAIA